MKLFEWIAYFFKNCCDRHRVLDKKVCAEMVEINHGKLELYYRISEIFKANAYRLTKLIQSDLVNKDHENLFKHAHELKGASLNIGAYQLAYWCNRICRKVEKEDFNNLNEDILKVTFSHIRVVKKIDEVIDR